MTATENQTPTSPTGTPRLGRWLSLILFGCAYIVAYLISMLSWLLLQIDTGTPSGDVIVSPSPPMVVRVVAVAVLALAGVLPATGVWAAVRSIRRDRSVPAIIGLVLNGLFLLSVFGVVAGNLFELTRISS